MLNQVVLVGQVISVQKGIVSDRVTIALPQPLKEDHHVDVVVPHTLSNIFDTITIPSIVAVKAHLSRYEELLEVIAERISFLKDGTSR